MKRFYDNIKIEESGCWEWQGSRSGRYGQINFNGRLRGVHVISYILHCDEVPKGKSVLHTCDNNFCVNPKHLFLGTQQDNMTDKVNKNRQAKGERIGISKLTAEQVLDIRKLLDDPCILQKDIALHYSVDPKLITEIKYRRIWRHV